MLRYFGYLFLFGSVVSFMPHHSARAQEKARVSLSIKSPKTGANVDYDDRTKTLRVKPTTTNDAKKVEPVTFTVHVISTDASNQQKRIFIKNPYNGAEEIVSGSGSDAAIPLGTISGTKTSFNIVATATFAEGDVHSNPIRVIVDDEAPIIRNPNVDRSKKDRVVVTAEFADDDILPSTLLPKNVTLNVVGESSPVAPPYLSPPRLSDDKMRLFLEVASLRPARYNLSIKDIRDLVSNSETRDLVFTVEPNLEEITAEAKTLSVGTPIVNRSKVQAPSGNEGQAVILSPIPDADGAVRVSRNPKTQRPEGNLDLDLKVKVRKGTTNFTLTGVSLARDPQGVVESFNRDYATVRVDEELEIPMRLPANGALPVLYKITATASYANAMIPSSPVNVKSDPLLVRVDERPPTPTNVSANGRADGSVEVVIKLDDDDIAEPLAAEGFKLSRIALDSKGSPTVAEIPAATPPTLAADRRSIRLHYVGVPSGVYAFRIDGMVLRDHLGNTNESKGFELNVTAVSTPSAKVEQTVFPEHVPRILNNEEFNPGDTVDTRVIRLFYFRDAHRVVQIINRDVQQLNKLGFEKARIEANLARSTADEKTDERRLKELEAVEAAKRVRELQAKLDDLRNRLGEELAKQQPTQAVVSDLQNQIATTTGLLASTETEAVTKQNRLAVAQATEDRAREDQFRKEVAAGLADPDSYAKGDVKSIDPVLQVSLSVVGEGMIQARGPLRGIFKIARMIHQLDTPVGQVKVGIHTVQVNGENGNRMELVYEKIDKHLAQSRFLTTQSLEMFRKAVVMVADRVASQVDAGFLPPGVPTEVVVVPGNGLPPDIRAVRYSYAFFGPDFIRELAQMDSELLNAENKLLALNSMDTISLAGAIAMAALADHPVRQDIIHTFLSLVQTELPRIEADYYRALTRIRHSDRLVNAILVGHFQDKLDFKDMVRIEENARRTYQFSGLVNHMNIQLSGPGTLNSAQFGTVRLAQALKSQLAAELELNNLRVERSLIETREGQIEDDAKKAKEAMERAERTIQIAEASDRQFDADFDAAIRFTIQRTIEIFQDKADAGQRTFFDIHRKVGRSGASVLTIQDGSLKDWAKLATPNLLETIEEFMPILEGVSSQDAMDARQLFLDLHVMLNQYLALLKGVAQNADMAVVRNVLEQEFLSVLATSGQSNVAVTERILKRAQVILHLEHENIESYDAADPRIKAAYREICDVIFEDILDEIVKNQIPQLRANARAVVEGHRDVEKARLEMESANQALREKQEKLFAKRLLDQLIDEQEEKAVELLEAMRSHVSNIDNYLKRIATAIEDDVNAQFYNPAFLDIRRASRFWDVTMGQIETTTILTNNRTFAKVQPTATMEFDLPKRDIMFKEGLIGAKALVQDIGNLANDPTFLTAAAMLSGQPAAGVTGSLAPVQQLGGTQGNPPNPELGAALQALVPEPEIYKFETGTGFEIRPVIQPDGQSIVYSFDYMYTTNIREPVNANEKHLGRVKRHFVHTDVQTSSYELREVSRYTIALRAARTTKGVPLLEDIPGVGVLFRPLPSAESSLQENIILASSVVYPTVFDLYGLRWSRYADAIESSKLVMDKKNEQHRYHEMRNQIRAITRREVNERIGIPSTARLHEDPRALVAPPGVINVPRFQRPHAVLQEDEPRRGDFVPGMPVGPMGVAPLIPVGPMGIVPGTPVGPMGIVPMVPVVPGGIIEDGMGRPLIPERHNAPGEDHPELESELMPIPDAERNDGPTSLGPLVVPDKVKRTSYQPLTPTSPLNRVEPQKFDSVHPKVEPEGVRQRRFLPTWGKKSKPAEERSAMELHRESGFEISVLPSHHGMSSTEIELEPVESSPRKGWGTRMRSVFRSTRPKAN